MSDNITVIISDVATAGTMGVQNSDNVDVSGGSINGVSFGSGNTHASPTITGGSVDLTAGAIDVPTLTKSNDSTSAASTAFVQDALADFTPLADGTLTGTPSAPTPSGGDDSTLIATTAYVQGELLSFAPLASPTFTGTPVAPTPAASDNTTKVATTEFVQNEMGSFAPLASPTFTGTPAAPTPSSSDSTTKVATTAFVQGEIGSLAPLASPSLTGNPTAPTQASTDDSTKLATTAFVKDVVDTQYGALYTTANTIAEASVDATPRAIISWDTNGLSATLNPNHATLNGIGVSDSTGVYQVSASVTAEGDHNKTYRFELYQYDNSASTFVATGIAAEAEVGSANDSTNVSLHGILSLDANDVVVVYQSSTDGGTSLTISEAQLIITKL